LTAATGPVLVTGGAGFLGGFVVEALRRAGRDVVILDRVPAPTSPTNVVTVTGDVGDPDVLERAVTGASAIIHAAFAPPRAGRNELHRVNVDATEALTRAAIDAGVSRLVIVSSTIVERRPRAHPLSTRLPLSTLDAYRVTRTRGEEIALAAGDDLAVAIARPCTFLGPGRVGAFALLFEAIRTNARVPILGPGSNRYQLLQVADLADGLIRLLDTSAEGIFHFGAPNVATVQELLRALIDHAGTDATLTRVPRSLARAGVRSLELAGLPPLSDWHQSTTLVEDRIVDTARAQVELSWTPAFSNERALFDAYDWFRDVRAAGRTAPTTHAVPRSHRLLARALAVGRSRV